MGYPFSLTTPTPGGSEGTWGSMLNGSVSAIRDRIALHELAYGVPMDSFAGTDDQKLEAALAYAAAQTRPPAIVLSSRSHTFNGGPHQYYPGLRMVGALGNNEREFSTTGPLCQVFVGGSALFSVPSGGVRNMFISGIQFRAASGSVHFQEPVTDLSSGPIVQDATWQDCGWVGFSTVMHARQLRCRIDRTYTNNSTDTPFKLAGSDNYYWQNGGYLSSTVLAASKYYCWFTHMSRSQMGPLYITPEKATGIRIDGSYGGFVFSGTLLDSTGRNQTTACQGAAILITGGRGYVFSSLWFFNNAVNPGATGRSPVDKGQVFLRGSTNEVLFNGCQFAGDDAQTAYTPAGTPAIYAATGVTGVKVVAPIAPAGGTKLLQQQSSGIISTAAAADWTLQVA